MGEIDEEERKWWVPRAWVVGTFVLFFSFFLGKNIKMFLSQREGRGGWQEGQLKWPHLEGCDQVRYVMLLGSLQ